jgi:hypothetical protein
MYVDTKVASLIYGVSPDSFWKAIKRKSTKYRYRYISGTGRGGRKLIVWVDDDVIERSVASGVVDSGITVYSDMGEDVGECVYSEIDRDSVKDVEPVVQEKSVVEKKSSKGAKKLSWYELSDKQKEEARLKEKIVLEWIEEYKPRGVNRKLFLEHMGREYGIKISNSSFGRWLKGYRENKTMGLVDTRGVHRAGKSKLDEWMKEFVLSRYMVYGGESFNYMQLWEDLHKEAYNRGEYEDYIGFIKGSVEPMFDVGVIMRYVDNYFRDKPIERTFFSKGEDKTKSYHQPAFGNQKENITRKNQCWQIDSSPFDIICRDGEGGPMIRANILAIVDVYSGRCVASLEKSSNALNLVRLMWKAISELGVPEYIKGDNGKDYLSKQYQELLNGLGISYSKSIAYAGDEKGFVERNFRKIQTGLSQTMGHIGGNLSQRAVIEEKTAKKDRKAKDEYGHIKKTNIKHLYTYEEMKKKLETEVWKWDITTIRGKKDVSSIDMWNMDSTPVKKIAYEEFLLYAGGEAVRKVSKKGIEYEAMRYVGVGLPAVGTEVIVRENIDNKQEIFVWDMSGNFVCRAYDKDIANMSAEEYKMVKKVFNENMREIRKALKDAQFSEFTRMNIEEDFNVMKRAHRESLKPDVMVQKGDNVVESIKDTIKEQRSMDRLRESGFDKSEILLQKREPKDWESVVNSAMKNSKGDSENYRDKLEDILLKKA